MAATPWSPHRMASRSSIPVHGQWTTVTTCTTTAQRPGPVGDITIPDAGVVAGDGSSIAVFSESGGYASIYKHKDLDARQVVESARITTSPHQGMVIPYEGHFIASIAGDGTAPGAVEVRDAGNHTVLSEQPCARRLLPCHHPGGRGAGLHGRGPAHYRGGRPVRRREDPLSRLTPPEFPQQHTSSTARAPTNSPHPRATAASGT